MHNNYNIQHYQKLLSILASSYNKNNKFFKTVSIFLENNKKNKFLNLNFKTKFFISSKVQEKFIKYDKKQDRFILRIDESLKFYNKCLNTKYITANIKEPDFNNIFRKYNQEEISFIINRNKIKFEDYIIGEFYKELLSSIVDYKVNEYIEYEDEFVNYKEKKGTYIKDVILEILMRKLSIECDFVYIPSLDYHPIYNKLKNLFFDNNICILLNGNITNFNYFIRKNIDDYEIEIFEEEHKLKKGTLNQIMLDCNSQIPTYLKRYNIKRNLKKLKKDYNNKKIDKIKFKRKLNNILSTTSFGFVNIFILFLFISGIIFIGITITILILQLS